MLIVNLIFIKLKILYRNNEIGNYIIILYGIKHKYLFDL